VKISRTSETQPGEKLEVCEIERHRLAQRYQALRDEFLGVHVPGHSDTMGVCLLILNVGQSRVKDDPISR